MPHAVEMPSFLADETGPSLSSNRPAYHTIPNLHGQSYDKVNGNTRSSSRTSMGNGAANKTAGDGMDGGMDGIDSDRPVTNSDVLHDGNLNALPNGRTSGSSWDRLSVNGVHSAVVENGSKSSGSQNGLSRRSYNDWTSTASTNGHYLTSSVETKSSMNGDGQYTEKKTAPTLPISTHPQITGPVSHSLPLSTAKPISDTPQSISTSTQKASSPAAIPTSSPAPSTLVTPSPSQHSLPHPGSSQLKHRHTLQVPKVGPARASVDEALSSSGRFSPTTPGGARRASLNLHYRNTQSLQSNIPHEAPPDEDAMLWAEAVRQKRASKRRRKDEEDDDRVVVGTKVDQNHVNWVTAYNMLTGIRFTVSRTNAKMDRPLTDADFDARHKFSFDITGNELTPSAKYDFKFKDYAPWVFRHLRAKFKLDPADYLMSLTSKYILSELGSPGKSGCFFYFSRDYKYIIKTIHHAEHKFLRKILKEYYNHVMENPNTLLSQFYGLHRVKMPYGRKIHFVIMNNLFPPHRDIHQTFDLKGSRVGRDFKEEELAKNPRATLKDLNWLRRDLHLEFGPEKKRVFFEQMEKDVRLLQRLDIMDYSMLVGIHDLQIGNQENLRDKTLQIFQPGGDSTADEATQDGRGTLMRTPSKLENARKARELRQIIKQEKPIPMGQSSSRMPETLEENISKRDFLFYGDDGGFQATHEDNSPGEHIFFLSIIDCLTHYGTVKKLEHFWKGLKHDKRLISPVSPDPYGERFIGFIEGITKSLEEAQREAQISVANVSTNPNISLESNGNRSGDQNMQGSKSNTTIKQNDSDVITGRRLGEDESDKPSPRIITTVRSPSAERTGGLQGQTLPVVEEYGEGSSTGGRSGKSDDRRPSTPPKDDVDHRCSIGSSRHATSPTGKRPLSRSSLDKKLPPLPK